MKIFSGKQKIAFITGGGTGLGQAIARQLAERGIQVFIVGRRLSKLKETQLFAPQSISIIKADISLTEGRAKIAAALKNISLDYLVHNAAIVFPIVPLEKINLKSFRKNLRTNLEGPLFLTQLLLPQMRKNGRILHISSDCAHYALSHWIPYCSSKAALFMAYQCLKKEFQSRKLYIASIDPGMMDTPMQAAILDETVKFPEKMPREELEAQHLLFSADFSAQQCVNLLLNTDIKEFQKGEHQVLL